MPAHWLMKSEPDVFSFADLEAAPERTTYWEGVRNYQARNMMRDQMKVGDRVFYYHSNCAEPGIVGLAEIVQHRQPQQAVGVEFGALRGAQQRQQRHAEAVVGHRLAAVGGHAAAQPPLPVQLLERVGLPPGPDQGLGGAPAGVGIARWGLGFHRPTIQSVTNETNRHAA